MVRAAGAVAAPQRLCNGRMRPCDHPREEMGPAINFTLTSLAGAALAGVAHAGACGVSRGAPAISTRIICPHGPFAGAGSPAKRQDLVLRPQNPAQATLSLSEAPAASRHPRKW